MSKSDIRKTIGASAQNLPGPIASLAMQFGGLSPEWALGIGVGAGLVATYRELATDRGRELQEFIDEHRGEFAESMVNTPEFISVFVNVWEQHIRETAESKRARLRQMMLSVGTGQPIPQDMYSKFYAVIQQMTDREATIFSFIVKRAGGTTSGSTLLSFTTYDFHTLYSQEEILDAIHSLHSYRLVDAQDSIASAVIENGWTVKQITGFGDLFYRFVLRAESDSKSLAAV